MTEPGKRAAGAGLQEVRIDNIKDRSWVEVHKADNLRGQIFFGTNDTELDKDALDQLYALVLAYQPDMKLNPDSKYYFQFFGYADHRHTETYKDNEDLSRRRATAVEQYLSGYLDENPNYEKPAGVIGVGVDKLDPKRAEDPKSLAIYRRVNIIAPPLRGVPPPPPPPPPPTKPKPKVSTVWKARMKASASGSFAIFTGDRFIMEFVDLENELKMEMRYIGFGFGLSPIPVGISYSASSKWTFFYTNQPVRIEDFEGFAFHTALQAQSPGMVGATVDQVTLTLAHSRHNPDWVRLQFQDFTILDPNGGFGGSQTGGAIQPTEEYGGSRTWSPTDP